MVDDNGKCDSFSSHRDEPLLFLAKMTGLQPGRDNPYLAHLPPSQRGAGVSIDPSAKEPLYGFLPRKVTGPQVLKVMVCYFLFELLIRT